MVSGMNLAIKTVTAAGVGASVAVWLAAVGVKAQVDGVVDWWPYPWLWLLAGFAVASGLLWVVLMLGPGRRQRETKAVFVLRRTGDGNLELERTARTPAYAVSVGDGLVSGSAFGTTVLMGTIIGDFAPGERRYIGNPFQLPPNAESWVWLNWIADGGRYYTKSQFTKVGETEWVYKGIAGETGKPFTTQ